VTVDLTAGGSAHFATPGYAVDFSATAAAAGEAESFGSLYRLENNALGVEEGFNAGRANGVGVMPDVDPSPLATVDVTLGQLGAELIGAQRYSVFRLDLDEQPGAESGGRPGDAHLALNSFQVFLAATPLSSAVSYADLTTQAKLVFDLDHDYANGLALERTLLLNDGGSAEVTADLVVRIPVEIFQAAGARDDSYLYLYSRLGEMRGFQADRGHEQWSFLRAGGNIPRLLPPLPSISAPETSTWLAGVVVFGLLGSVVWRRCSRP
jgi:hypothetical protein